MWYQIKSYLLFLLKSKNQHGVHSPFVYDLVSNTEKPITTYSNHQDRADIWENFVIWVEKVGNSDVILINLI